MVIILDTIERGNRIDVRIVNYATQHYFDEKLNTFDTEYDKENLVQELWDNIYKFCIEYKRKTAFLVEVSPNSIDREKNFKDLIDSRLIHLVEKNTTNKHYPGKRFNAYILNMGSYAKFLNIRKNPIQEIDILQEYSRPGDSPIRSTTPILKEGDLKDINELIQKQNKIEQEKIKRKKAEFNKISEDIKDKKITRWI